MGIPKRIFVSVIGDELLNESQKDLKKSILENLKNHDFIPEMFYNERYDKNSLTVGKNWDFDICSAILKRCVGSIIIGFPRHETYDGNLKHSSEYNHIEGALSVSLNLPTLLLADKGIYKRGIFSYGGKLLINDFPSDANGEWLKSEKFIHPWDTFYQNILHRKDIFLGYCSTSSGVAGNIKRVIEGTGASVLDWKSDFTAGQTIIQAIEDGSKITRGGIFLFTKDDKLEGEVETAAPRDNVVFEAGFFTHSKGEKKVLIILERGAKMPADLGGNIYLELTDRSNIEPLLSPLTEFLKSSI